MLPAFAVSQAQRKALSALLILIPASLSTVARKWVPNSLPDCRHSPKGRVLRRTLQGRGVDFVDVVIRSQLGGELIRTIASGEWEEGPSALGKVGEVCSAQEWSVPPPNPVVGRALTCSAWVRIILIRDDNVCVELTEYSGHPDESSTQCLITMLGGDELCE